MFITRVSLLEKLLFTKSLSVMINSGITITEALEKLKEQASSRHLKKALHQIMQDCEKGQSLSKSMKKHPKIFDQFYLSLIEVGEGTGNLGENLTYLTEKLSKNHERLQEVRSNMFSQFIVLGTITVLIAIIYSIFL